MVGKLGSFMDTTSLKPDNAFYVMLKQLLRISPEIYKIQQICEPERTTNNIATKMVDIKSGKLLVEKYVKGGIIDSATRISVSRPVWFVKTYSHLYVS